MSLKLAIAVFCLAFSAAAPAMAAEIDWTKVDTVLTRSATVSGDVHRYGLARSDLHVSLDGLALKGWLAFEPMGDTSIMMGDVVLTESEINPVMNKLLAEGLEVTAVHNHLLRANPPTFYMHVFGRGDPAQLAQQMRVALEESRTPFDVKPPEPTPAAKAILGLDTDKTDAAIGFTGRVNGGVYQLGLPRLDSIKMQGMTAPGAMGTAIASSFQPTGDGKAAITGDFVALADEVSPLVKTLRENGIEVTAIHNHMLGDEPRAFFVHFWANDDALKLAKGLRAALNTLAVKKN